MVVMTSVEILVEVPNDRFKRYNDVDCHLP